MPNVYFIQYEVRPAPGSEEFGTVGGAYVNCFITAASELQAIQAAQKNFEENKWVIVCVEEGPYIDERRNYEDYPEWLEYFDEAVAEGECYVFCQWPPEPQEEDVIH